MHQFNPQVSHCRLSQDLLLPISSHGLITATVSSWVHPILSSNLSRQFKTLLQVSFSWHPATDTQHLFWKNCTGFSFQNVLSRLYVELLHVYALSFTLRSSDDTRMLKIQQYKASLMAFALSLALNPTFGIHSHKTLS